LRRLPFYFASGILCIDERLRQDLVFAFDQASGVLARGDVAEADVLHEGTEKRDALADEHGDLADGEAVDLAGAEKILDGDAAVNIDVLGAMGFEG
jgi:hypothetical protein